MSIVGSSSLTNEYSLAGATSSHDFRDHLPFLDAFVADRLGVRDRPPIGKQIHQIRRTKFQVGRMMLRRVAQLRQHVFDSDMKQINPNWRAAPP